MEWQPIITCKALRVISHIDQGTRQIIIAEKDTVFYFLKSITKREMQILSQLKTGIMPFLNNDFYMRRDGALDPSSNTGRSKYLY